MFCPMIGKDFQCPRKNTDADGCQCWQPSSGELAGFCGMMSQAPDWLAGERIEHPLRAQLWQGRIDECLSVRALKDKVVEIPSLADLKVEVQLEVAKTSKDILSTTAKTAVEAVIGTVIHDAVTDAVSRVTPVQEVVKVL